MSLLDVLADRDRREQQESLRDAVDRRMKTEADFFCADGKRRKDG